jgi:predicted polyphosphate/ATP-dependent NAD kinase
MTIVGIIPNPASGKDIRRLVAHALVVGNREKTSIVRRMLIGLEASGIEDIRIMPDTFGIGRQAVHDLKRHHPQIADKVSLLDMEITGSAFDTTRAAHLLREAGAACVITLGGDGTARLVAKGCGPVPILPVSTGTNNVLPQFIEGTIAGLAAGLFAQHAKSGEEGMCYRRKRLDILVNGKVVDMALVDVAAVSGQFIGSRAVWDAGTLRQVAVTQASPVSIGLSAIVGLIQPISVYEEFGVITTIQPGGLGWKVLAPVGPGILTKIPVADLKTLSPGFAHPITAERPIVLALDGEREITLQPGDEAAVLLRLDGPWIVQVEHVLERASQKRWLIT